MKKRRGLGLANRRLPRNIPVRGEPPVVAAAGDKSASGCASGKAQAAFRKPRITLLFSSFCRPLLVFLGPMCGAECRTTSQARRRP